MKNIIITLLLITFSQLGVTQEANIDLVIHKNNVNTEYGASKLIPAYFSALGPMDCINLTMIDSMSAGNSPYILEIWEPEEFLRNFVFKEKREKAPPLGSNAKPKKYTVAGVKVRTKIHFYGRLIERNTKSIVEIFKVKGDIDKEIQDEDVKAKYKPKWIDNRELNDAMLEKHSKKIASLREETYNNLRDKLGNSITNSISLKLLNPVRLTEAVELDKDKIKKIKYEKCNVQSLVGDGSFTTTVYSQEELNGVTYYVDQGGVYASTDKKNKNSNVFNVRGGKKEIFRAYDAKKPLFIGRKPYLEQHDISEAKNEKTIDLLFMIQYPLISTFEDFDKIATELFFQSKYLGHKNIRVLAYNPLDDQVTNKATEDIDTKSIIVPDFIFVGLSNMKKIGKGSTKYGTAEVTMKHEGEDYSSKNKISGFKGKTHWTLDMSGVTMDEIRVALVDNSVRIVGVIEEKKDEVKMVLVESVAPIQDTNYKIYDKKRVTKKTKEVSKIDIKEATGRYTAIAEVKDGKKELKKLMASGKALTFVKEKGGMFSLSGSYHVEGMRIYR